MKKDKKVLAEKSKSVKPSLEKDFRRGGSNYSGTKDNSDHIKRHNPQAELEDEDEFVDEYDSGYDNEEGYDDYEVRSSRVDFDHDFEQTRGKSTGNLKNEKRNEKNEKTRTVENETDRDFDELEKTWEHSSNVEDKSQLDLFGGEPIGRNIRDRYTADLGEGPRATRRSGTSVSDETNVRGKRKGARDLDDSKKEDLSEEKEADASYHKERTELRKASKEKTRHSEWDENPEDYLNEKDPETLRRQSIYKGVRTKHVKSKSMTKAGVGSEETKKKPARKKSKA